MVSQKIIKILRNNNLKNIEFTIILGIGYSHKKSLNNLILKMRKNNFQLKIIEGSDFLAKFFRETDFAITDLSHSRAIIELDGENGKEVLKKGCPYNFNELNNNNCINSTFNGMSVTIDILNHNPNKIRIFTLRSFGESLYHSITDSCLEFGYKSI